LDQPSKAFMNSCPDGFSVRAVCRRQSMSHSMMDTFFRGTVFFGGCTENR
jgi:hypothetical protein